MKYPNMKKKVPLKTHLISKHFPLDKELFHLTLCVTEKQSLIIRLGDTSGNL